MIAILGGGISGLSAAYELKKAEKEFILLEQNNHVGGKIRSLQKDGFVLELGPNTVLLNNKEIKELIDDLKLSDQLVFPEKTAINNRFVLKNGKPEPFPNSPLKALKSRLFRLSTLLSIIKEPFIPAKRSKNEESLASLIRRRFGKQILDDFITPFVTGIYAGNPEKMSANYTMNMLQEAEEQHGSIMKGMIRLMKRKKKENEELGLPKQKIFIFETGLQTLINKIEEKIQTNIKYNTQIKKVLKTEEGYEITYTHVGKELTLKAERIISCVPSYALADFTETWSKKLREQLLKIKYVPAVTLHISFPTNTLNFNKRAFGILSRNAEKVPFLGILFNSHFFPHTAPKGQELITVICGGSRYPDLALKEDQAIQEEVILCLKKLLGAQSEMKVLHLTKWKRGIPQYEMGYSKIEKEINHFLTQHSNIHIAANFYNGISVSDCIKNGKRVAQKLLT